MKTSIRRPYFVALISLFTDPLFTIQSPSTARDKNKNRGGFITASADEGVVVREEENRQSVDRKQFKLAFPRKSKLSLAERRLSCHHHERLITLASN